MDNIKVYTKLQEKCVFGRKYKMHNSIKVVSDNLSHRYDTAKLIEWYYKAIKPLKHQF